MNLEDTVAVLAYFGAAWPTFDPSDDTVDVWLAEVADIDPGDAQQAMRSLVRTSDFPPTIAKFRAECQALAQRRRMSQSAPALLPPQSEWPKELVADLKAMLKEMSLRNAVDIKNGRKRA